MASVSKLPFEPNRYEKNKQAGNDRLKVNTKEKKLDLPAPLILPWSDDSSWEEYKSRTSQGTSKQLSLKSPGRKKSTATIATEPMSDELRTTGKSKRRLSKEKVIVALKVFESSLEANEGGPEPIPTSEFRRPSTNPMSITSGLMGFNPSISMSSLATSEARQMSPTEAMYRGLPYGDRPQSPLKYATLKFNDQGIVDTKTSLKSYNERVIHYPVGEFYKPHKLSKSITLPVLTRPSVTNFSAGDSFVSLASHGERSATADTLIEDLKNIRMRGYSPIDDDDVIDSEAVDAAVKSLLPAEDKEDTIKRDQSDRSSVYQSIRSDGVYAPHLAPVAVPTVPYQIHNRVLGSKLLPLTRSSKSGPPPSRQLDAETAESLIEAPAAPYQVHKRIMGWKLTSVKKRKELVRLLDVVNSDEATGVRLRQAFEEQGISSFDIGNSSPPKSPDEVREEQARLKKTSKRIAASWEKTVSRMVKARVGALDAKAEFQKQKQKREASREARSKLMLSQSFSPTKSESQWNSNWLDSRDEEFESIPIKQSLLGGSRHSVRDLMKPSFEMDPKILSMADAGLPASLAHNIRALSPPLVRPVETYTSTVDLLVLNERLDILKTAEALTKGMKPSVSPPARSNRKQGTANSPSSPYHASFLNFRNAPVSPPTVRVASPTMFMNSPGRVDHGMHSRMDDDDEATTRISLTSEVPLMLNPTSSRKLYSVSLEPLGSEANISYASKIHSQGSAWLSEASVDAICLPTSSLLPPEPQGISVTDSQLLEKIDAVVGPSETVRGAEVVEPDQQ